MRSASRSAVLGSAFAALALFAGGVSAQDTSGMGTWRLNAEKSKFGSGPAPKSLVTHFEAAGKGVKWRSERTAADGKTSVAEYTGEYDGKEYPLKGSPAADAVVLRRVNATTTQRINKKDGKVVSTETREVAKDGRSYTTTVKGTGADGKPIEVRMVFDKQ